MGVLLARVRPASVPICVVQAGRIAPAHLTERRVSGGIVAAQQHARHGDASRVDALLTHVRTTSLECGLECES